MNKQRVLELADAIERNTLGIQLEMDRFFKKGGAEIPSSRFRCATAACMAGWACLLWGPATWGKEADGTLLHPETVAGKLLDLTDDESSDLFYGHWCDGALVSITAEMAVAHLRKLAGA